MADLNGNNIFGKKGYFSELYKKGFDSSKDIRIKVSSLEYILIFPSNTFLGRFQIASKKWRNIK